MGPICLRIYLLLLKILTTAILTSQVTGLTDPCAETGDSIAKVVKIDEAEVSD
jgi:hypothetical protein